MIRATVPPPPSPLDAGTCPQALMISPIRINNVNNLNFISLLLLFVGRDSIPTSLSGCKPDLLLCVDHIRIEGISQAITDKIDRHDCNEDHQAGEHRQPRRAVYMDLRAFENIAPAWSRGLDAKPKVAQA